MQPTKGSKTRMTGSSVRHEQNTTKINWMASALQFTTPRKSK